VLLPPLISFPFSVKVTGEEKRREKSLPPPPFLFPLKGRGKKEGESGGGYARILVADADLQTKKKEKKGRRHPGAVFPSRKKQWSSTSKVL